MTNLKNLLLENYSKYFDDLLSGEQSLPFGLLVLNVVLNIDCGYMLGPPHLGGSKVPKIYVLEQKFEKSIQ